jgi:hypothetical protein
MSRTVLIGGARAVVEIAENRERVLVGAARTEIAHQYRTRALGLARSVLGSSPVIDVGKDRAR